MVRTEPAGLYYVEFRGWMTLWLLWQRVEWPYKTAGEAERLMRHLMAADAERGSEVVRLDRDLRDDGGVE